jgi:outer membrane protein assembly factor BamB
LGTTSIDYLTIAYDLVTGKELWRRRFDAPTHDADRASGVGATHDGSKVVVTGESFIQDNYYDIVTLAYDAATGQTLWKQSYDGPWHGEDYPAHSVLAISPDDAAVYITGTSSTGVNVTDMVTVAYPLI